MDALVKRMWFRPLPFKRRDGKWTDTARWQVSQIHLAVDVANAPLDLEQADRFVSRSRTQAVYQAAKSEVEQLMRTLHGDGTTNWMCSRWTGRTSTRMTPTTRSTRFDDLVPDRDRDIEPVPVESGR